MPTHLYQQTLPLDSDRNLRCTVAVPEPLGDPVPLVLALHYGWDGGAPAAFYGQGVLTGLVGPALAALGALIAAPDCPGPDWTAPESEAALSALWGHLHATYALDDRRTLVTGYSLGGMGTWHLASRHPERFRAAIAMAGWPAPGSVERLAVPLYAIHSRDDEVISIAPTVAAVAALRARGHPVEFVTLEGITHYEVEPFGRPLQAAAAWVQGVWGEAAAHGGTHAGDE
jgi:predicted peptidase